jgi:hypothetical protein
LLRKLHRKAARPRPPKMRDTGIRTTRIFIAALVV